MRANVNITRKQRHTLTLENFKGVDLSSSPLRVSTQRATYMRNLWSENGANHKRPGWREIFRLDGRINGVFPFEERSNGEGLDVLLVHAGTKIFRVVHTADGWTHEELREGLTDTPSRCFYQMGRAYIIGCGAYLVYGEFDGAYLMKDVSEIAYVPTTTVSINSTGFGGSSGGTTLDAVNLVTPWRKNTLLWVSGGFYKLDAIPAENKLVTVKVDINYISSAADIHGKETFSIGVAEFSGYPNGDYFTLQHADIHKYYDGEDIGEISDDEKRGIELGYKCYVDADGWLHHGFAGLIPNDNMPHVEVLFQANVDGSDKIQKCTIGALFGVDGASDRLFLSGNPDEKGLDRWSEADDFTYFPDGNAMFVGGGESAVTGYARLSDGTLGIFKEEVPGYPTIYYRTGAKTTMVDADGATVPQEYFPVEAGMAGEGLISPRAVANLAGDPLILTPSGVFGVELSQNVASGERYAKERSRAIREELCKKELAGAVGFAWRGKYYLSLGDADGTCYVADSRYKASFEGSADVGYEWWVWDHVPATAFAEIEDALAFGTAEGRVCAFEQGMFADHTYIRAESGHLTVNAEKGYITYGGGFEPQQGDAITLDDVRYTVVELDAESQHLWLKDADGKAAPLASGYLTGVFERAAPVVAEWASAVMDLGTSMARKTLLSCGVMIEPGVRGPVQISLKTRDGAQELLAQNGHDFDFGALDFGDLSFTGSFAASSTFRTNLRNFNFIQLRLRSDKPTDMSVAGVTLEYKINQTNRGYY